MTVVSAFIIPASPLPMVHESNPPWGAFAQAMREAGKRLEASAPDVMLIYSTAWYAVLDQLWQTRKHLQGIHVDENWHEYGTMPFEMKTDQELAMACIEATPSIGVRSRAVDYDAFPIDTGTIVAAYFLNPDNKYPVVITSNNLYHNGLLTEKLAALAVREAHKLGRRVALVGIGGLSGSFFRHDIDIATDHIENPKEDQCNKDLLEMIASGDAVPLAEALPSYAVAARADMGMKHLSFVLGALGGHYTKADVLHYGPLYGSGGAVIHFTP